MQHLGSAWKPTLDPAPTSAAPGCLLDPCTAPLVAVRRCYNNKKETCSTRIRWLTATAAARAFSTTSAAARSSAAWACAAAASASAFFTAAARRVIWRGRGGGRGAGGRVRGRALRPRPAPSHSAPQPERGLSLAPGGRPCCLPPDRYPPAPSCSAAPDQKAPTHLDGLCVQPLLQLALGAQRAVQLALQASHLRSVAQHGAAQHGTAWRSSAGGDSSPSPSLFLLAKHLAQRPCNSRASSTSRGGA